MPDNYRSPGIYTSEIPSQTRPIQKAATTIAAFPGRYCKGPIGEPVLVKTIEEFEETFGNIRSRYTSSTIIRLFFENGGRQALIYRLFQGNSLQNTARFDIPSPAGPLVLRARNAGSWGNHLRIGIKPHPVDANHFNLGVDEQNDALQPAHQESELYERLTFDDLSPNSIRTRLRHSRLLAIQDCPDQPAQPAKGIYEPTVKGEDGGAINETEIITSNDLLSEPATAVFDVLCLPSAENGGGFSNKSVKQVAKFCAKHKRIFLMGSHPAWTTPLSVSTGIQKLQKQLTADERSAVAIYYPNLKVTAPMDKREEISLSPVSAVAGIMAHSCRTNGIWKAPAGMETAIMGSLGLTVSLSDNEIESLASVGVNGLKQQSPNRYRVMGARTLDGSSRSSSPYKYLSVKRMADYIELATLEGCSWAIFEPNNEATWAVIRTQLATFMETQFRAGAFAGLSPQGSYFIRCDANTTTAADLRSGLIRINIGFAPVRPSEFITLNLVLPAQSVGP